MQPHISVIIPAFNEERLLGRCLEALIEQNYPKEKYEILVIDNGSHDNTVQVARKLGVLVFTYKAMQGCAAARHYGASKAKGGILAFTDADSAPEPDWLSKIEKAFQNPNIICIGGGALPDTKTFRYKAIFGLYHGFDLLQKWVGKPLLGGYNMAVKTSSYKKVGGFNKSLLSADDWDLSIRLYKQFGSKAVIYMPELRVYVSTRKQKNLLMLFRYTKDSFFNYINLFLLEKRKVKSIINVR